MPYEYFFVQKKFSDGPSNIYCYVLLIELDLSMVFVYIEYTCMYSYKLLVLLHTSDDIESMALIRSVG